MQKEDLKYLCTKIDDFVQNSEFLKEMIKITAKDGVERGCEIRMTPDRELSYGKMCTGEDCRVMIDYTSDRIASFHTHANHPEHPYTSEDLSSQKTLSTRDIIDLLELELVMECVGRLIEDKPNITCNCVDSQKYKDWLIKYFIVDYKEEQNG